MDNPIGVGVIGANPDTSWAAFSHLPAIAALPQYELKAVATSRAESAAQAGERFGVPAYDDYRRLVEDPSVELVTVAVKPRDRRDLVLAALDAGKHVLCEWPLGNGPAEAAELAEAARGKEVVAAIGLQGRAAPVVNHVRELVAEGYVGEVLSTSLTATCWVYGGSIAPQHLHMTDAANGATFLTIQTAHVIDAMAYCLGELEELTASIATVRPDVAVEGTDDVVRVTTPDQVAVSGRLSNGALASVHLRGGTSRGTNLLWEINGTEGDLVFTGPNCHFNNDDGGVPQLAGGRGDDAVVAPLPLPEHLRWVPDETPDGPPYNIAQLYTRLARDIRESTELCATFDDALRRHEMVEAIQRAADEGKRQVLLAA